MATFASPTTAASAVIGKTIVIKGDIDSQEPLTIEGQVEGTIEIGAHLLTVASGANVRANITGHNIDVRGRAEGNVEAAETVYIRKDAEFIGDIHAASLVIEDGCYVKGNIDLTRRPSAVERRANSIEHSGQSASRDMRELSHAVRGS